MQFLLEMEQLLTLALHHLAHGDACPARYYIGNVVGRDLLLHHCSGALSLLQLFLNVLYLVFQLLQFAVADFCHTAVVALAFGTLGFEFQLFYLLLVLLDAVHQFLLALPFGLEGVHLLLQLGYLMVQVFQLFAVTLSFDGLALDLQLFQPACFLVQFLGHGVALHTQLGSGLVHEVNGLVGQETLGDISGRELDGGDDGIVLDTYTMVVLVAFLQSTQDADARECVRFIDHDGLESSLECLVLLEVFLILVERSGTDASQFASCQCGFQNVGGIHGALALSGTYQRMYFVDEQDDTSLALRHLVHHAFQSLLKLAFVLGTGYQRAHVQRV